MTPWISRILSDLLVLLMFPLVELRRFNDLLDVAYAPVVATLSSLSCTQTSDHSLCLRRDRAFFSTCSCSRFVAFCSCVQPHKCDDET